MNVEKAKKYDSLGIRMKKYEATTRRYLTIGTPKIIRLDMRAGHTFCRGFDKPFDNVFAEAMIAATKALCEQISGAVMGYTQSDEISIVLNDMKNKEMSCFFDGNVQKIVSISTSICVLAFNKTYARIVDEMEMGDRKTFYQKNVWTAQFDCRVFELPNVTEVHNCILWRQNDATRNSIQMAGHAVFTDTEMHKKNTSNIQDMLMLQKGINWNDYPARHKRGICVIKEVYKKNVVLPNGETINDVRRKRWTEYDMPILTQDKDFISKVFSGMLLVDGELQNI